MVPFEPCNLSPTVTLGGAYFEITSVCNARCPYCYNNSTYIGEHLPLPIILSSLAQLYDVTEPVSVTLSGGEPCLHPNLSAILEAAAPLHPLLITNGTFLHKEQYRDILQYCHVQLTLEHPSQEQHDTIRGPGNFRAVQQACQSLKREFPHHLLARVNVSTHNAAYLADFAELAVHLGFSELHYSFLLQSGRSEMQNNDLSFSQNPIRALEVIETIEQIRKQQWEGSAGALRIVNRCKPRLFCALTGSIVRWQPRVTPNGEVYVCEGFLNKEAIIGNLHNNSLEELANSQQLHQYLRKIRHRTYAIEKCKTCPWKSLCLKGCPGDTLLKTGSLLEQGAECAYYKEYYATQVRRITFGMNVQQLEN